MKLDPRRVLTLAGFQALAMVTFFHVEILEGLKAMQGKAEPLRAVAKQDPEMMQREGASLNYCKATFPAIRSKSEILPTVLPSDIQALPSIRLKVARAYAIELGDKDHGYLLQLDAPSTAATALAEISQKLQPPQGNPDEWKAQPISFACLEWASDSYEFRLTASDGDALQLATRRLK